MAVGPDRVQVLKRESAALGGNGADDVDYPTPLSAQQDALESAGVYLQDASNRDETTYVAREGADMVFTDQNNPVPVTLTTMLSGGGISSGQHEALDSLVHEIAETSYVQVGRTGGRVTSIVVWETVGMLKKIRETLITRASGQVSVVVEKQFDSAGVVVVGQTLTHTVSRSGGQVGSIASVET